MRMPATYSSRGQTTLEYLLLLAIVAVVVIAGFGPGSLISQVHDAAQGYYNTVTSVIMGDNPKPIDGGWCPVTCPPAGSSGFNVMYGACECPPPAFGGSYCPGVDTSTSCGAGQTCKGYEVTCGGGSGGSPPTITACGPCPTGQSCNAAGICTCPNGLACGSGIGPTGSVPGLGCGSCICPLGTTYDLASNSCDQICTTPCTTYDPVTGQCDAVVCPPNSTCDPTKPAAQECACDQYSYWNGTSCAYCQADGSKCTAVNSTGTGCADITCSNNEYCDAAINSCQCILGTYWHGNACVTGSCTPTTACPTSSNGGSLPSGCGTDSCGGNCGANGGGCPSGQACSSSTGPGTCVTSCPACQSWNGSACVTTTPCGSNNCGSDSCGNSCGTCTSPNVCSSTSGPGICGTCTPNGSCTATYACGSTAGKDNCGNACTATAGTCLGSQTCTNNVCTSPVCTPNGSCTATYQCGSTAGTDNCGNACAASAGTCQSPQICINNACSSSSVCTAPTPCGSPGNCTAIPSGACDCAGDINDACGVCGGNGSTCAGGCDAANLSWGSGCSADFAAASNGGLSIASNTSPGFIGIGHASCSNGTWSVFGTCRSTGIGGCFVSGTRVFLANGKSVKIQNLKTGDVLLGSNGNRNKVVSLVVMPKTDRKIYAFNNGRYFVTENHSFMTTDGWKAINPQAALVDNPQLKIGQLKVGDDLRTRHGLVRLKEIKSKTVRNVVVYSPTLDSDGTHDYYADGFLVHNKPAQPVGSGPNPD